MRTAACVDMVTTDELMEALTEEEQQFLLRRAKQGRDRVGLNVLIGQVCNRMDAVAETDFIKVLKSHLSCLMPVEEMVDKLGKQQLEAATKKTETKAVAADMPVF